jgi:hypothetical protein
MTSRVWLAYRWSCIATSAITCGTWLVDGHIFADHMGAGMASKENPRMEPVRDGRASVTDDLAERIEGYIERKACGQIRDLHVVCSDEVIILQGRSRTYHAKQLAQEAALDLAEGRPTLANQIVVC